MTGRKGDTRRETEQDRMFRYAVQPLGDGHYGIYDRNTQEFIHNYSGRGAMGKANRKWLALVRQS
jgi:hypothetical protein